MKFFALHAKDALSSQKPVLDQKLWATKTSMVQCRPRGVVAIIKPWNYPLEMIVWSLAPALLAGNAVIIKPSEKSPVTGSKIREMAEFAQLPPGVINIVFGDRETGKCISDAEGINYITFTGSTVAGRDIAVRSGQRLRPYALELGGNDAAIVLDDVNIELAANGLAWGAFCNAGQVCVGIKRAYVLDSVFDLVAAETVRIAENLRLGTDLGPIIDETQLQSVSALVDDAIHNGAKALAGGRRHRSRAGWFYEPTVLSNVPATARLLNEECFGPVLPLIRVKDVEEAVERANASTYGLGASIWTSDLTRGRAIAERVEAGMVWVNDVNVAFPQTPWGGIKSSGVGFELSLDVLREYTTRKHTNIENSAEVRRPWWYPYDG